MHEQNDITETLARRGGTYGDFRENARIGQNIKKAMRDSPNWHVLPPYMQEGLELIALKMSRMLSGDPLYHDNPHDLIGYAKLIEDRAAQDREAGLVINTPADPLYPAYQHTEKGGQGIDALTGPKNGVNCPGCGCRLPKTFLGDCPDCGHKMIDVAPQRDGGEHDPLTGAASRGNVAATQTNDDGGSQ